MTKKSIHYTYLISSLPMLQFGMKKPFSFGEFLEVCGDSILNESEPTLKRWRSFDTILRNALVNIRAARKHKDPTKYLRKGDVHDPAIAGIAMNAYKNPSILESEKMLDGERWRFLNELESGHFFDIDFLIVYARKLLILERWERINTSDKSRILEEVLA